MATSFLQLHRTALLSEIRNAFREDGGHDVYKFLICDKESRALLRNSTFGDDVLNNFVADILMIEDDRICATDTPALYFLTPSPYVVELLKVDLSYKKYQQVSLTWTSAVPPNLEGRFNPKSFKRISRLDIDFYPEESHLITFRDPESFQILFNESCDPLIKSQVINFAQRILSICIMLDEDPEVRYYQPRNAVHRAKDLCGFLAREVEGALDKHRHNRGSRPAPSARPRSVLLITDRTMDLMAPLVHEMTYQAMAKDLLAFSVNQQHEAICVSVDGQLKKNEDKLSDKPSVQLTEQDPIWVENRHLHMKDLLVKLPNDLKTFKSQYSEFQEDEQSKTTVDKLKNMMSKKDSFMRGKNDFELHIAMVDECVNNFRDQNLPYVSALEQCLATGVDEEDNRPKNVTDQLVRLLVDPQVLPESRLRLLMMYIVYRGGILEKDITKLRNHAELLFLEDKDIMTLDNLGARAKRELGDYSNPFNPVYPYRPKEDEKKKNEKKKKEKKTYYEDGKLVEKEEEEESISRFEPLLRYALEDICADGLDDNKFPSVRPRAKTQETQVNTQTLRAPGKPTWASNRPSANRPRQRILVFVAGGATYSEARACYEISARMTRDIILITDDMWTPKTYVDQIARLHLGRDKLNLKVDAPVPQLPKWVYENRSPAGGSKPQSPQSPLSNKVPVHAMQSLNLGPVNQNNKQQQNTSPSGAGILSTTFDHSPNKLKKEKEKGKNKALGLFRKG